jgi:hypothetical protein
MHILADDDTTGGFTQQAASKALDAIKAEKTWNPDTHYAKVVALYQGTERIMTPARKKRGEDTQVSNPACTLMVFKRTAEEVQSILEARKARTDAENKSKTAASKVEAATA